MTERVDLFGDPVPDNYGRRGRPAHVPTRANRDKVALLLAFGWSNDRIANSLCISLPTLRSKYAHELKVRVMQRDRLDAHIAMKLLEGVNAGNVGAIKELRKLVERNDQMNVARSFDEQADRAAPQPQKASELKLGKKEAADRAAETAGAGSEWGDDLQFGGGRPN